MSSFEGHGRQHCLILSMVVTSWLMAVIFLHAFQFAYGFDPFAAPIVNGPYVSIDSWSFIHVLVFAGSAFLFPERALVFFLYGVAWEVIEAMLAGNLDELWGERAVNSLWDIWFNLLGYRIGEVVLVLYLNAKDARAAKQVAAKRAAKKKN